MKKVIDKMWAKRIAKRQALSIFITAFAGTSLFVFMQYHIHNVSIALYYPYFVGSFIIAMLLGVMFWVVLPEPVFREYEYVINGEEDVPRVVLSMHMAMAEAERKNIGYEK